MCVNDLMPSLLLAMSNVIWAIFLGIYIDDHFTFYSNGKNLSRVVMN